MDRSLLLTAVILTGSVGIADAGPCMSEILRVEQQIKQASANSPSGVGSGTPSAPQSIGAQLHHQPTPGSVRSAEHAANVDADAALARARAADAAGDAKACAQALQEVKRLFGLD
jgi:hypothetical protein